MSTAMPKAQTETDTLVLLESASLHLHSPDDTNSNSNSPATVHRGMIVQTKEGCNAGHVAAVVLDRGQQEMTAVLLVRERRQLEYRLIPVALIQQVAEEQVLLGIIQSGLDLLPAWHSA